MFDQQPLTLFNCSSQYINIRTYIVTSPSSKVVSSWFVKAVSIYPWTRGNMRRFMLGKKNPKMEAAAFCSVLLSLPMTKGSRNMEERMENSTSHETGFKKEQFRHRNILGHTLIQQCDCLNTEKKAYSI